MLSQQKAFIPIITEAADGDEAMRTASKERFDVILLDINLPVKNGIVVTKMLRKTNPAVNILVLTMHNEEFLVNEAISAGALGYLLKNVGIDELTKAILTVGQGKRYYCNDASQVLLSTASKKESNKALADKRKDLGNILSKREIEIIRYIVNELSSFEIGEKLFISRRTVDGHRKKIIAKLNLKNTAGIVKFAIQNDLFTEEE
jgi:DNA-binding NarL/FixJ family response regulator